jgi:Ulp1 family protease
VKRKKNENECVRNPIICHDMENVIQEAINKDLDEADKMCEDFNITIYRKDIIRLRDGNWLNDKVSMKYILSFT